MDKVRIGRITGTYALKGWLKIVLTTSDPTTRFATDAKIYLGSSPENCSEWRVGEFKNKTPTSALLKLNGAEDINEVTGFVGQNVYADKIALNDAFYIDDIIGFTITGETGKVYGRAEQVYFLNGRYHFQIGKIMLPFDRPRFISTVDTENRTIVLSSLGEELFA